MYTVRYMRDGELLKPLEEYDNEQAAFERMDDLLIVAEPDTHIDVYDEQGKVLAAQYVTVSA